MLLEARSHELVSGCDGLAPCHDNVVKRREIEMAEGFSGKTPQAIAVDSARGGTARNGKAESCFR